MENKCPTCHGRKTMVAFVEYAEGYNGPPVAELPCHRCDGAGSVSSDRTALIERGESFRRYRIDVLKIGLRRAAEQWNISPLELSYIEQGDTVTDWTPPGYSNYASRAVCQRCNGRGWVDGASPLDQFACDCLAKRPETTAKKRDNVP